MYQKLEMSYGKMSQTLTILSNVNEKKAVSFTENEKDNILGDVYFSKFPNLQFT